PTRPWGARTNPREPRSGQARRRRWRTRPPAACPTAAPAAARWSWTAPPATTAADRHRSRTPPPDDPHARTPGTPAPYAKAEPESEPKSEHGHEAQYGAQRRRR